MNIRQLFTLNKTDQSARELYEAAVGQARLPEFYLEMGVADTLDGRFDMIILHVYLLARRLRQDGGRNAAKLQESLFEVMFADMDRSLREMGVGDLSVGKQVKRMAKAFLGACRFTMMCWINRSWKKRRWRVLLRGTCIVLKARSQTKRFHWLNTLEPSPNVCNSQRSRHCYRVESFFPPLTKRPDLRYGFAIRICPEV